MSAPHMLCGFIITPQPRHWLTNRWYGDHCCISAVGELWQWVCGCRSDDLSRGRWADASNRLLIKALFLYLEDVCVFNNGLAVKLESFTCTHCHLVSRSCTTVRHMFEETTERICSQWSELQRVGKSLCFNAVLSSLFNSLLKSCSSPKKTQCVYLVTLFL